jgi:hypothetical protein
MGIEPTRAAVPELENKRFGAMAIPKCDWRVNFRGMWGYVGIHRWATSRARAYQSEVSERPKPAGGDLMLTARKPPVTSIDQDDDRYSSPTSSFVDSLTSKLQNQAGRRCMACNTCRSQ